MTRDDYFTLLKEHDDPVHWEYPPDFNYERQTARVLRFVRDLEPRLGGKLEYETDSHIQDASFHSQVMVDGACLRFSNFGNMIATTDDDSITASTLDIIKSLAALHGYIFIPSDLLNEVYTGTNPGVTGIRDWAIRYFDWV